MLIVGCGGQTTSGPSTKPTNTSAPPDATPPSSPANTKAHADASPPTSPANPPGPALAAVCKFNSDCPSGLVCWEGLCHAECETARDCPPNQRCIVLMEGHVCQLAAESACSFNSDCAPPLVCAPDRACRNRCLANRDCIAGEICAKSQVCANPAELDPSGDLPAR